jgi:hypothetical protein
MIGVRFRKVVEGDVFAFLFPYSLSRTFWTAFCPRTRIVALSAEGDIVFDEVIEPWRLVSLPFSQIILQMDPATDYRPALGEILLSVVGPLRDLVFLCSGEFSEDASLDRLIFEVIKAAVADVRSVKNTGWIYRKDGTIDPEGINKLPPKRRGEYLNAAGFIVDLVPELLETLPPGAVSISEDIMNAEPVEYHVELYAAAVASDTWTSAEMERGCLRCGTRCGWREVVRVPDGLPAELAWRFARPENHVPLCKICIRTMKLAERDDRDGVMLDLAWGLWGRRFEAFFRWYQVMQNGNLPKSWDRITYPLWPEDFGGRTWEDGSGHLACCSVRGPAGVVGSDMQRRAMERGLNVIPRGKIKRATGDTPSLFMLHFHM